ncbi:hypothetical protein [Dickeya lacustris]|uniref:Integrase n=1 Tax=Dickeya lacustris TaxID=2259638 RepID=A0ABY8G4Y6_9GAMM|nr:hypothetical protein [Dickeya lacustris]WFN55005.1 hypothetical protein O1Q98_15325 [Dickeya lacustris]
MAAGHLPRNRSSEGVWHAPNIGILSAKMRQYLYQYKKNVAKDAVQ